jgi:5-methylcytosine-specific restriction endonuclease McrA
MATTKLQRMMFLQGRRCYFCARTIPTEEASVDHLVPSSAGGLDHSDNLVACCKTLNAMFGNMSVKEKIRVVLNQRGTFTCPNQPATAKPAAPTVAAK